MADSLKKFSVARGQVIHEGLVFIFCSSQSDFKSFLTIATTVKLLLQLTVLSQKRINDIL